jgi:aldehyde:ferredoxin oxidoreductase
MVSGERLKGYMGKVLWVNLTQGELKEEAVSPEVYENFLGGYGLGVKYLYERMEPGIDPLGPDNILGFTTGPLNQTGALGCGRYTVVAKSPLTGTWGDANSGGHFAPALKSTGYDAIFFTGRASKPVYLYLGNGTKELRDASHIWGRDTNKTEDLICQELGDNRVKIASIGPAGEKLSLISCIINDKGRAAARSGLGAVMGSKNLKALAVRGTEKTTIANEGKLKELNKMIRDQLALRPTKFQDILAKVLKPLLPLMIRLKVPLPPPDAKAVNQLFHDYGTAGLTATSCEMQDAPIKNWLGIAYQDFPMSRKSSKISDDYVIKYQVKKFACANCVVACGGIMEVKEGEYAVAHTHKPEYETAAAFGAMTLNDNIESIIMANDLCNRYGFDTISAGVTIAFALECFEKGALTAKEADGLELTWGNHKAIIQLLRKMGTREGIGEVFADGVKVAAQKIGKGTEQYAIHVAGQEIPMHDPRLSPSFGTTYCTDPTPARHTQGGAAFFEMGFLKTDFYAQYNLPELKRYDYENKGKLHVLQSNYMHLINCAGMCLFYPLMYQDLPLVDMINAVTGWNLSLAQALRVGDRIHTLRHCFNLREGFSPKDFQLPPRAAGIPPLTAGPIKGVTIDIDTLIKKFYLEKGWDPITGIPSEKALQELGLKEMIGDSLVTKK